MTTKCIAEHLEENWANENYLAPISVISSPDRDSTENEESTKTVSSSPLVDSEIKILDFDKITRTLYPKNYPTSADGIFLTRNSKGKINKLYLVEFKGGFYNKTPKKTAEYKKGERVKQINCWIPSNRKQCTAMLPLKNEYSLVVQILLTKSISVLWLSLTAAVMMLIMNPARWIV